MPNNRTLDLGDVSEVQQLALIGSVFYDIAGDFIVQLDEFVKNLCSIDYQDKFEAVRGVAHPTAGRWLLKKKEYIEWKEGLSASRLLWLGGVPGSGKTVLSSIVIANVEREKGHQFPVIFCFCDRKDDRKRDPKNILCSLLGQLLQRAPRKSDAENKLREQFTKLHLFCYSDFAKCIMQVSREIGKTFVIIDGLDECDCLPQFLPILKELGTELYIFVTSRHHRDIREHFRDHTQLTIRADDIAHDVQQFVRLEAERITKRIGVHDEKVVESIVQKLTSGAQGTFLWPACHIEQLRESDTLGDIEKSLHTLPSRIGDTVAGALKAISRRRRERFERSSLALKFVLCATRPLTLPELVEGVATAEMTNKWELSHVVRDPMLLVDSCANLLICIPLGEEGQLEIVAPFHDFVKRFMLADPAKLFEPMKSYALHHSSVHTELARLCLSYLKLKAMRHYRSVLSEISRHPFAAYAVAGWLEHIRASGTDALAREFQQFLAPEAATFEIWRHLFARWSGSFASSKVLDHLEHLDPAHLAVWFDLPMIIPHFSDDQLCAEDYRGLSALHVAMDISSSISVIDQLLDKVDVGQLSKEGKTALHVAITQFQAHGKAVIQRLWEAGAEMNAMDSEGRTALHLAMLNPGRAMPCIVPLLQSHADPNARDRSLCTPLHIAASAPEYVVSRTSSQLDRQTSTAEDYIQAMKILLVHGADVLFRDEVGNTPLHLAANSVNAFAVEFLLNKGAYVNAVNDEGCTPLHLAISSNLPTNRRNVFTTPEQRDQELTVALLLRHAAPANLPVNDDVRNSPLHLAALSCCKEPIFSLLIDRGVIIDSVDLQGNTPLQIAAKVAPILNPNDPVDQWRISWVTFRQIVCKLVTDESNRPSLHQTAQGVLHLIGTKYADVITSASATAFEDDLEPEHPSTMWFDNVKKLLCSNGAKMNHRNDEGQDILSSITGSWASWIRAHHPSIADKRTVLLSLFTEWTRISKL